MIEQSKTLEKQQSQESLEQISEENPYQINLPSQETKFQNRKLSYDQSILASTYEDTSFMRYCRIKFNLSQN